MRRSGRIKSRGPVDRKDSFPSRIPKSSYSSKSNPFYENVLFLQRTIGNQAMQRLFKSGVIQAKFKMGQPNDIYEQEADRVAGTVLRMPEPVVEPKPT
jgi:hypothetical protein